MDFKQTKLTKEEWCALEVPVSKDESKILKMIYDSWGNPEIQFNDAETILVMMRITENIEVFHQYFYENYFKKHIDTFIKQYGLQKFQSQYKISKKLKIKKKDTIRINNLNSKIEKLKDNIYEYLLLKYLKKYLSSRKSGNKNTVYYFYLLKQLLQNNIRHLNIFVEEFIVSILKEDESKINMRDIIINAKEYIEQNKVLIQYSDVHLYSHQKEIIYHFKDTARGETKEDTKVNIKNKMVLYQAPTGTGKTMTPIALSRGKRIIFVCAAKHIGLQLAKSSISMEIPIAIAFGCDTEEDIRLHYYAAKDYTKNYRTGSIYKVDNSVGDKVELMISDVQSYLSAMNYMLKFNKKNDIIWYWDEPTISLDYTTHEFHDILQKNWNQNLIPNIVLSSATLPNMDEITPMLQSYISKFNSTAVEVLSYECKKSIPIISSTGYKVMPHYSFEKYEELQKSIKHLERKKTILRHFDVDEISKFIIYLNDKKLISDKYLIKNYFPNIDNINIINIKMYYLLLLKDCEPHYNKIYKHFQKKRESTYKSTIKITTNDAHTLTDGPTIFLTNNVEKLANLYLRVSEISETELESIMTVINKNQKWKKELDKIQDIEKQRLDKIADAIKERSNNDNSKEFQLMNKHKRAVEQVLNKIKSVQLKKMFVPNTRRHLKKWTDKEEITNEFTSDIEDSIVEDIMILNVEESWKILLLMGIGVFMKKNTNDGDHVKYMEIMKKLAEQQKLYLIIASSDYIYGTNYQFCHGYLSKDLLNMTQEKQLQAFGRIGRQYSQLDYTIRIRDESLVLKLLLPEENKIEVNNMNKLFKL